MKYNDIDEPEDKQVCFDCIGDSYLKELVRSGGVSRQCSYCGNSGLAVSLRDLAEWIEEAFEVHYAPTSSEPDSYQCIKLKDKESNYTWERAGEPVVCAIANAAKISEEISEDVRKLLDDKYYDFDEGAIGIEGKFNFETHYEEIMPNDGKWRESWKLFKRNIKTKSRFFSRTSAAQLKELFYAVDEMTTNQGKSLIIDAGPNTDYPQLYRARVFQDGKSLTAAMERPDKELVAPPSQLARPGRMNASGISVFYGAISVDVALAEVRPPVDSHVVIVRFEIIRPIRLLDITALREVNETGSVFDPDYANRLRRFSFLRKLSHEITQPVMPNCQETEYLPTQAIADFLATESRVPLDGILFPSEQVENNGLNVVLFHKASRCKKIDIPKGTKFETTTYRKYEDAIEPDFIVIERVPSEEESYTKENLNHDDRKETLSVDVASMTVHIVSSVQVHASRYKVARYRF